MMPKEKELRLALVCFGGVSLAIYEHGITREILSLLKASRAFHSAQPGAASPAPVDGEGRRPTPVSEAAAAPSSTEGVYRELLEQMAASGLRLRVIVDVIAGASAGGVNGIVLARAIAHDLPLEPVTRLWLEEADIERLVSDSARAGAFDKWYLRPFLRPALRRMSRGGRQPDVPDQEVEEKLSLFLRSRWFSPPLDGPRLSAQFLDALESMGEPAVPTASLLPEAQQLDLLVTVTDFHGSERTLYLHDPPVVREREHRHVLRFSSGRPGSAGDFGRDGLPALAFAARATASYPGAFPPAQIREMDEVLAARRQAWAGRSRFIERNFGHYAAMGLAPEDAVLLDGGVLDNKPIRIAAEALRRHAAFREVDRRLIYVEPDPGRRQARPDLGVPGWMHVFRGALTDLPRHEPINDELAWIERTNAEVRRQHAAIDATRPNVVAIVREAAEGGLGGALSTERIRRWRLASARLLGEHARVPYNHFIRLMIGEGVGFIARLICDACGYRVQSPRGRWISEALEAWAHRNGIFPLNYEIAAGVSSEAELDAPMRFIVNFDLAYRYRRIFFVIRTINRLYPRLSEPDCQETSPAELDLLKRRLYRCLDSLRIYENVSFLSADAIARIRALFGDLPEAPQTGVTLDAEAFFERNSSVVDALIEQLNRECDLVRLNEEVDAVMASPVMEAVGASCREELLVSYLGYLFWDIILLPMLREQGPQGPVERQEIMVDRISPEDARTLRMDGPACRLRGTAFGGFGGFLSRAAREHDYLWGRLNGVDRLFDVMASSARRDLPGGIDDLALRIRALRIVLQEERGRLGASAELIEKLDAALDDVARQPRETPPSNGD
ncbi:MAG: patatin-like protein [Gammaproteobacteria bacterium]